MTAIVKVDDDWANALKDLLDQARYICEHSAPHQLHITELGRRGRRFEELGGLSAIDFARKEVVSNVSQ